MGIATLAFIAWVAYLLFAEGQAVIQGHNSTISEMMWVIWTNQPWAIWLPSVLIAFLLGFFSGHFFGQSSDKYDAIRKDPSSA